MILLENPIIVTGQKVGKGSVLIEGDTIVKVIWNDDETPSLPVISEVETYDLEGKYLIAGGIDAHVHFRDPGLTHKADMETESRAAVAGGVTTVFDMPNTKPPTVDARSLAEKKGLAVGRSLAKIGFHIGASNINVEDVCSMVEKGDPEYGIIPDDIPGVKVFMGSSTGNMLVDDESSLKRLFRIRNKPVLVHCEDEAIIRKNIAEAERKYGEDIPFEEHEKIRSRQACIRSSIKALELAMENGTKLVLCHISTKEEINMVKAAKAINSGITAETSCNYLWFNNKDYSRLGSHLKCNPSVKTEEDMAALREALRDGIIDTIGSDHAPHLLSEKDAAYAKAPSGLPSIQQSLPVLLTIARQEDIPLSRIASVFSENAAKLYGLDRGIISEGYKADLVVFDYDREFIVEAEEQYSKCGWTPYQGEKLCGSIETVYIDGKPVLVNGKIA